MKELLSVIISILILIIFFEMFCSNTRLSGFIKFVFSSLIVFIAISFLSECIEKLSNIENIQGEIIENSTTIAESQVEYLESIIENRLEIESGVIGNVNIDYEIDGNNILQYLAVDIYLIENGEISTEEVKKIVQEYLDCQVNVYD